MLNAAPGTNRSETQLLASGRSGDGLILQHTVYSWADGIGLTAAVAALKVSPTLTPTQHQHQLPDDDAINQFSVMAMEYFSFSDPHPSPPLESQLTPNTTTTTNPPPTTVHLHFIPYLASVLLVLD